VVIFRIGGVQVSTGAGGSSGGSRGMSGQHGGHRRASIASGMPHGGSISHSGGSTSSRRQSIQRVSRRASVRGSIIGGGFFEKIPEAPEENPASGSWGLGGSGGKLNGNLNHNTPGSGNLNGNAPGPVAGNTFKLTCSIL
jgi:hypothetical protein